MKNYKRHDTMFLKVKFWFNYFYSTCFEEYDEVLPLEK